MSGGTLGGGGGALAINNSGLVTGYAADGSGYPHAFLDEIPNLALPQRGWIERRQAATLEKAPPVIVAEGGPSILSRAATAGSEEEERKAREGAKGCGSVHGSYGLQRGVRVRQQ